MDATQPRRTTDGPLTLTLPDPPAPVIPPTVTTTVPSTTRNRHGVRFSRFVFTLNNYTEEEYNWITEVYAPTVRWIIVAKETGASGTPHLQGAVICGLQVPLSKLKTSIGFRRAHLETMLGKPSASRTYCTKQDMNAFERGTLPQEGKRNDLQNAWKRLKEGATIAELAEAEETGVVVIKYHRGLTQVRSILRPARTAPPLVFWVRGPTGLGKTRFAYAAGRSICTMLGRDASDIWISNGSLRWFDGYDRQPVCILDDFRAKSARFEFILRLLDRYPLQVEFKGGSINWDPHVIFLTCPHGLRKCFAQRFKHVPEDIHQIRRRITGVFRFKPAETQSTGTTRSLEETTGRASVNVSFKGSDQIWKPVEHFTAYVSQLYEDIHRSHGMHQGDRQEEERMEEDNVHSPDDIHSGTDRTRDDSPTRHGSLRISRRDVSNSPTRLGRRQLSGDTGTTTEEKEGDRPDRPRPSGNTNRDEERPNDPTSTADSASDSECSYETAKSKHAGRS